MFSLPLGQDQVKWHVWLDEEALWNRLRTLSHFAVLEGELLKVSASHCYIRYHWTTCSGPDGGQCVPAFCLWVNSELESGSLG
jgi:hypothetical protein